MFGYLEKFSGKLSETDLSKLIYYFERHIELDSDTHGPYGNADDKRTLWIRCAKWAEVEEIAKWLLTSASDYGMQSKKALRQKCSHGLKLIISY
jgi:hypothetical protein